MNFRFASHSQTRSQNHQARKAACSFVAGESEHWTHLDRPESVIRVIREVVAAARSTRLEASTQQVQE